MPSPRKENRAIGDRINFGYVGVLQNHKGIEDLVRAFVTVNKGRAQLLIYGEGDRLRLTKQIPPSELQQIQFKGIFGKAEKTAVYESIDFLIVPSRCYETFSFVAREALYYGKPVIAPAHSVFLEIVKPRENGLLFSPLNWRSLSRTLEDVITQNIRIDSGRIESKMPSFDEHICQLVSVYQSFENKR
ncbi:MAG: glycosyltransferase [candidate division WOR-3 bacterium]